MLLITKQESETYLIFLGFGQFLLGSSSLTHSAIVECFASFGQWASESTSSSDERWHRRQHRSWRYWWHSHWMSHWIVSRKRSCPGKRYSWVYRWIRSETSWSRYWRWYHRRDSWSVPEIRFQESWRYCRWSRSNHTRCREGSSSTTSATASTNLPNATPANTAASGASCTRRSASQPHHYT